MSYAITLKFHFVPTVPPEALIEVAGTLDVEQVTERLFGATSIDAAALKILSYGASRHLGLLHLGDPELANYPHCNEIICLDLPVRLIGAPKDFADYAWHHYDTPRHLSLPEQIHHTILNGELAGYDEVMICKSTQHPPSHHAELVRRNAYSSACCAYAERLLKVPADVTSNA